MKVRGWVDMTGIVFLLAGVLAGVTLFQNLQPGFADAALSSSYSIASSTRFVAANSDYMTRTPGTTSSRTTFTFSAWVKTGVLGTTRYIFNADGAHSGDTTFFGVYLNTSDQLAVTTWATTYRVTRQVFRDPAAWNHIVVAVDSTQATTGNRIRVFVNGLEASSTALATIAPLAQNTTLGVNVSGAPHYVSGYSSGTSAFDGYLADVNFVDGQQLMPSFFGALDSNGIWRPIPYTGLYGTNGFHLLSSNANALGADSSINGNNFSTSTNIKAVNQVIDTPTNNFATMNRVDAVNSATVLGGVDITSTGSNYQTRGTIAIPSTGKWYFEATDVVTGGNNLAGIASSTPIATASTNAVKISMSGGSVFGFAVDMTVPEIKIYKDNVLQSTTALTSGVQLFPFIITSSSAGSRTFLNFGQGGTTTVTYDSASGGYFRYTPPSGFKALSVPNLPAPAIGQSNQYFDAKIYFGTSTSQTIGGLNFQPDLVWLKATSTTADNGLFDSVRGIGNVLISNKTDAEAASSTTLTSFNSDGFTLGAGWTAFNNPATSTPSGAKANGAYVSWNWKKTATAGFDIVTYNGDNTSNRNISHSLGAAPEFVIVKRRDSTGNWWVWHTGLSGATSFVDLNSTAAQTTTNTPWGTGNFSSTQFMVTNNATENANGIAATYMAYLFRSIDGFSKFGSYTGNGSTDGPFIYTGFKPRWLMIKRVDGTDGGNADWIIYDTVRGIYNANTVRLYANLNNVQSDPSNAGFAIDLLSNGFKLRTGTANYGSNTSAGTYIYAAFAEQPFALTSGASLYNGNIISRNTNFKHTLYVAGAVAKGSGTFVIDHPLDPKNKLLYHSFVESPDMKNVYDGIATLDGSGEATIDLPDYFLKLNKDYRYLATAIGKPMPNLHLRREAGKKYLFGLFGPPAIKIAGGVPGGKVSWQVTGIRQDPVALENPVLVEVDKDKVDLVPKGQYLHPDAYGK